MKCIHVKSITHFLLLALLIFIVFTQSVAALDNYTNETNATTAATGTNTLEKHSLLDTLIAKTDEIFKSFFGTSPEVSKRNETIEILDSKSSPVISDIKTYDETKQQKKTGKTSSLSVADIPDKGELEIDAIASKNVAIKFKVNTTSRGEVILDDYGKNNPVSVPLPGRVVKYVEIGARNISFSSANVTIRYTDSELNGGNEYDLTIYHWNGASWDDLPTIVDMANKTLSASTTSLSPFGVATSYIYYFENNATNQSVGANGNTNFSDNTTTYPVTGLPYKNLLKNGTMGTTIQIQSKFSTVSVEMFRFYLPFNYSIATNISNVSYKITFNGRKTSDIVNVSLWNYNYSTGDHNFINGSNVTTGTNGFAAYTNTIEIPNGNYTIPAGGRLMVNLTEISTTGGNNALAGLQFNDTTSSYIIIGEKGTGGGVNLTNISALSSTTIPGTNSTYYLNLINNGTLPDTYTITTSNPDGATTVGTNITSFILNSEASKVFTLTVTNTSANATPFRVNVTATAANSSQFGYINTTTTVATAAPTYIPPAPTGLSSTKNNFWVNYTWSAGSGNVTNSYNVSVNGTWTNGSSSNHSNTSVNPHGWSNISVYSFNSSGTGTMNATPASANTQVSNNPITIGNVSGSYTLTAGNTLSIYPNSSDLDNDMPVFARNFTNGTFYTNNGTFLWTTSSSDVGNHSWQINVSDGNGSVSAANFTVTVNALIDTSFTVSLPIGETKAWFNASLKTQNVTARNQTASAGFLNITNTGNVNENFYFNITSALPSGVTLNAGTDNNSAGGTVVTTTSTIIISGLTPSSSHYVWLWTNFVNASPMDTQRTLQFNSSQ